MHDYPYDFDNFSPVVAENITEFKANRTFTLITHMNLPTLLERLQAQPFQLSLWKVDMRDLTYTAQDFPHAVAGLSLSNKEIVFTVDGKNVGEVRTTEQMWEEPDEEHDAVALRITQSADAPFIAFWHIVQEEPTQKLPRE